MRDDPAVEAVEREGDALSGGLRPRVERDHRQAKGRVARGFGQPRWRRAEINGKRKSRLGEMGEANNAEAADLQQARKRGRRAGHSVRDLDPVIRHQHETAIQKPERKVRLAGPRRPQEDHADPVQGNAARMDLHGT